MLVVLFPRRTNRVVKGHVSPRRALFILYAARKRGYRQHVADDDGHVSFATVGLGLTMVTMFPNDRRA